MNNRDSFNQDNDQLVLSYELLKLMRWIMEYEPEGLKRLIKHTLSKGLVHDRTINDDDPASATDVQLSIVEFMHLMEILLLEALNEHSDTAAVQQNLVPSLNKIDSTICDDSTIRFSLEHATTQLEQHPNDNPKEVLFKELLKRWKPDKKNRKN